MTVRTRTSLAWTVSILVHTLLFVFVLVGGGGASAGPELYEVGLADMPGRPQAQMVPPQGNTEAAAVKPETQPENNQTGLSKVKTKETKAPAEKGPSRVAPASSQAPRGVPNGASTLPPADLPGKNAAVPVAGGGPGGSGGQGRADGPGSGEGFVLNRPVYYPKNVQNEGKEGTVRVIVTLSQDGVPSAELAASSGDERLDRYALRAVTEAWQYTHPGKPVRIFVSIVFSGGKVEVVFEKSEYLNGGGETP